MIVHSKQSIEIPNCGHFGKYMLENLRRANQSDVCVENGTTKETLTYKEITQYAVNLSAALTKLGVKRGDIVAIGSEVFLHMLPTLLAVTFTGAAYTPYKLESGKAVLTHQLQLVKPKYFICSTLFWEAYKDVLTSCDFIETYIAVTDIPDMNYSLKSLTLVDIDIDSFEPKEVQGEIDTAVVFYSSGTTGMPKGVEITHYGCILTSLPDAFRQNSSLQTAFMTSESPWHMNYNTFMTYKFLVLGRKIIFMTDISINAVLSISRDCKVNIIFALPAYMRHIAVSDTPIDDHFDTVEMIYCRSFPLREHTISLCKKRFPKVKHIIQALGLTECGEPISEIWAPKYKPGSVGVVAPGMQVKVVDPRTRAILGPNQQGELCIKGGMIMKGYLDIDRFDYFDENGYYKTGDLGYFDEDQYFYIIDRLTDIINVFGYKVSPVEVENILLRHPGVLNAGVIGKLNANNMEIPMAFVVKKPNNDVTESELIEFVACEVSPHMQLKGGVRFISELPRNSRGKTLRRKLKELLNEYE